METEKPLPPPAQQAGGSSVKQPSIVCAPDRIEAGCPVKAEQEVFTPQDVMDECDEVRNDVSFEDFYDDKTSSGHVMFRGKKRTLHDVTTYVQSQLKIEEDPSVLTVRQHEVRIGNLLGEITAEQVMAEYASRLLGERKRDLLAKGKDRKKSKDVIEAELAMHDPEFRVTRALWFSADFNWRFWSAMKSNCLEVLERLKQIYYTLAAETRVNGRP